MFNSTGYSLADIAAATDGNNEGFGGNGAWWVIILFLLAFGGWGGNGFGGRGKDEISYGFDMNGLENGIRSVSNGLCDGFYALNTGLLTGFNGLTNSTNQGFTGLNTAITNGFASAELARCNSEAALMAQLNAMTFGMKDCCCGIERAIDGVNYNMATNTCATTRAIADAARDIIENANANYRALHEENVAIQMAQKDDRIAALTAALNKADLAASQAAQNNYLIGQLRPSPEPAYIVPNPFVPATYACGC